MNGSPAQIRLKGKTFDLSVRLGDGRPTPTGGGAKLGEEARPQRKAVTVYEGDALVKLDVPVLLDGWRDRRDVEPTLERLRALAEGDDEGNGPPVFKATGPIPHSGMRFQMEMPEEGEGEGDRIDGRFVLLSQKLVLKLTEFVDPDDLRIGRRHRAGNGGTTAAPRTIVTVHDDTLLKIASRVFGDPGRAKEIGNLNGIRDITEKLKAGRTLKLPR